MAITRASMDDSVVDIELNDSSEIRPIRHQLSNGQAFGRDVYRWAFIIAPPAIGAGYLLTNVLPPTYYGLLLGIFTAATAGFAATSSAFGRFTHPGDYFRDHADGSKCNPDHHLGKGFGLTVLNNVVTIGFTGASGLLTGLLMDLYPYYFNSISRSTLAKSLIAVSASTVGLALTKYSLQTCISDPTFVEEKPELHWFQHFWKSYVARPASTIFFMLTLDAIMAVCGRGDLTTNPHMQLLALVADQIIDLLDVATLHIEKYEAVKPTAKEKAKKVGIEFGKILLAVMLGVAVMEAFAQNSSLTLQQSIFAWWIGIFVSTLTKQVSDNAKEIYTKVSECSSSLFNRCRKSEAPQNDSLIITEDLAPQPI